MLGLLGGLLGGALRGGMARAGGGGVLSGLMQRRGGGGGGSSMPTYSGEAPKAPAPEPTQQEPSGPSQPARAQEPPPQQPREAPMVQEAAQDIQQGAQSQMQQTSEQRSPIRGLLDEAKPSAEPPKPDTDRPPEPPSVVNRTDTLSPVAPQQSEMAGSTPKLQQTDTIENRLFDSASNKQVFQFQEGMPDESVDINSDWAPSLGLSYQQSTTVGNSSPGRRYRSF